MPLSISVAMCTHNGARFLAEQLQSIQDQERPPDELVICDDRSSDDTVLMLERFARQASYPVRLVINERQLGSTRNFDQACGLCSGDLIALSDQDDWWSPAKLAVAERAFLNDPELGGFISDAAIVDQELKPLGRTMWQSLGFDRQQQRRLARDGNYQGVLTRFFVQGSTLTFRRDLLKLAHPFPAGLPNMIHDRWLAFMISAASKLRGTSECLLHYRQHGGQQMGIGSDEPLGALRSLSNPTSVDAYRMDLQTMAVVTERLCGETAYPVHPAFLDLLTSKIGHLQQRLELRSSLLSRLSVVAVELLTGRYHRFSNGFRSATRDILRGGIREGGA